MPELDLRHPFTAEQALAAGISPSALRSRRFRRVYRGVYIDVRLQLTSLVRVEAALLIHQPLAFASSLSAARLYDAPLPDLPDEHVSVFDHADRRRRAGIHNHVAHPDADVAVVRGLRCSSPEQTFVELAAVLSLVDLVVVGDFLVRTRRTTPAKLVVAAAAATGAHAVAARHAAGHVRRNVDSPMETRLRMLIVLAGLPEPEVDFRVYYRDGAVRYRFDLSYPGLRLIVEYDGRQHRDDLDQWDHDNDRDDWLDHNGWMIVKVFSRGIYKEPDKTIMRVYDALRARGCRNLPRVLSEAWRPHFPFDHRQRRT